jgi:mono/diheme cytochrome c family protein
MLAFLLLISLNADAQYSDSTQHLAEAQIPREVQDRQSKSAFANLQFFAKGHGMHLSPGLSSLLKLFSDSEGRLKNGIVRSQLADRWGLQFNDDEKISGFFDVPYKNLHVGVVGCVVCHSGRAAGKFIIGLGNKNVDVVTMASDIHGIEETWQALVPFFSKSKDYKFVEKNAMDFSNYLANRDIGNLTQGLVPVSFIRGWFYRIQSESIPPDVTRGQVKVPFLWGYGVKRHVGQFCDGYGNGNLPGWAIAVELAAGQTPKTAREYLPNVDDVENLFENFLPPKYPFSIQQTLADQGSAVFAQSCAVCHGSYTQDQNGFPNFEKPKFIDLSIVQTDPDRLNGNIPQFNEQVMRSPLADVIQFNSLGRGYFAPRLEGIWARFPYLHNGSVPNVRALLTPPNQRPKYFSLKRAGERERFDSKALGLTLPEVKTLGRDVYDTQRVGHSNQGHNFFTGIQESDKLALIEYLKTL